MLAPNLKNKSSGNKKIAPAVAAAIVSGASALGSTGLSAWNTSRVNRSNQSSVDRQNQFAVQLRNYDNWYNSPVQQMKRFREAGLNPDLIYGSMDSASSSAPSLASPSTDVGFDTSGIVTSGSQLASMMQQQKYIDAQTENLSIQNAMLSKDLGNKDEAIRLANEQVNSAIDNMNEQTNKIKEEVKSLQFQNDFNEKTATMQYQKFVNEVSTSLEQYKLTKAQRETVENSMALVYLQQYKAIIEIALAEQQYSQNARMFEKQIKEIDARIAKLNEDTEAVRLANQITSRDFNIQVYTSAWNEKGEKRIGKNNNTIFPDWYNEVSAVIESGLMNIPSFIGKIFRK